MQFFPAGINDVLGSSHLYLHVSVAAMFSSKLCRAKVHLKTKRPDPTLYPSTAPLKVAAKPRMNSPLLESAQKVLEEMETVQQPPVASLPYSVSRTTVGKGLPVYIEVLKGKTLYQTRVKKVEGDAKRLVDDLAQLISRDRIHVNSTSNVIEVRGHYVHVIKQWLSLKGF